MAKREPKTPQEVAKEMKDVITLAKQLSPNVRVVELPPRQTTPEIATKVIELNEELDKVCKELQVPFVNIAGKFYTADGNVNAALLDDDVARREVHLVHRVDNVFALGVGQTQEERAVSCRLCNHSTRLI